MMKYSMLTIGALFMAVACTDPAPEETETYAAFDLSALDTNVSPCTDFFDFSSGGWIAQNPIPETENRWGKFNVLRENNRKRIKGLLEEYAAKSDYEKGTDAQLIGDLFYSGMDSVGIEADGVSHIEPHMQRINALNSKDELLALMAEFSYYDISAPMGIYVSADLMNSGMNALYMSQSGLGLPDRDYYLKDDSVSVDIQEAYKKHLADIFSLYGMENAEAMATRVYNVEYRLAEKQKSRIEMRDVNARYNPMTYDELKALSPNLNFDAFFNVYALDFDTIILSSPEYIAGLSTIVDEVMLDDWKAYYNWKVLNAASSYLPSDYVALDFAFYGKKLGGKEKMQPRWKRVQGSMWGLSEQLGHLYVQKYFSEESKEMVEQMVEDLRSAYRDRINGLTWMTDATKQKALEKLDAFTYKIGYPDKWKDYSDLDLNRDSYLLNAMNLAKYKTHENLAKLGKPVDRDEWGMGAHIVNAYYNPLNNEVVFPAGILQPPFFDPKADAAINYGAIGGVIGHEFTHGFDDQGSQFDAQGNLNNWWTEEDKMQFESLTNALADQYDAYEAIPGVFVQGKLTLGENIADLGGLTLAYYAYQKHMEGKDSPEPIDGFTADQRVFLGWAQVWQSHSRDEQVRNQVMTDPHSPAHFRVVGPMSNMPEFKEAWGCSEGDPMVRDEQIVIW
jgi:putative endopeptidase